MRWLWENCSQFSLWEIVRSKPLRRCWTSSWNNPTLSSCVSLTSWNAASKSTSTRDSLEMDTEVGSTFFYKTRMLAFIRCNSKHDRRQSHAIFDVVQFDYQYSVIASLVYIFSRKAIYSDRRGMSLVRQRHHKYCKGLTLSRQQQLKMFLKQLFMLHLFFVSYFHRKTAFSQPQFSVGKQYDLIKWIAFLRQAQIMLLNWQNFLNVFITSTLSVMPEKYNPK